MDSRPPNIFPRSSPELPPVPIFPKDVPQSLCSTFISVSVPYVPQRYSLLHMFPSPFVPQSRCSSKVFPVPMFPKDIPQSNSFVPQSRCSRKVFPVPMFPKDIPQSLCSLAPLLRSPLVPSPHASQSL